MHRYEYKTVAAPRRERRFKGVKPGAEGFARTIEDVLNAECVDGWEYLRAESLPCDSRGGFFSRGHELLHTVLIFRRALPDPAARPELSPHHQPVIRAAKREPEAPHHGPKGGSEPTSLFSVTD